MDVVAVFERMRMSWHEAGLCLVCVALSVLHFFGPALVTASVMDPWIWHAFYGAQGLGGLVALVAIFWQRLPAQTRLKLEQAGMLLVASAGIVYAAAVFAVTGGGFRIVPVESLVLIMWVGSSLARAWEIRCQLRQIRSGGP